MVVVNMNEVIDGLEDLRRRAGELSDERERIFDDINYLLDDIIEKVDELKDLVKRFDEVVL